MSNRLAKESSPYLLQHKNNPVDWYPWGEEALSRARAEDKPILLSVGYSACHWCHVMAHESFENAAIAELMNERFINIKVDREERPDLDQIYQNVAQALTRSGGWPLTVFLTPDLKPFFGGTYFPPEDRYGRPGFPRVLQALSDAYQNDRAGVVENARRLTELIASLESIPAAAGAGESATPSLPALSEAASVVLQHIDRVNGGLGGAPKFPNPMVFSFLWRLGLATDRGEAREATLLILRKMARGGIFDQLGGGFHRYSVDATWCVPHFEKMLYDNGLLLKLYSEVLISGSAQEGLISAEDQRLFRDTISQTVDYVLREMRSSEGAFYSAQDADTEGEEGKYFVWDLKELSAPDEPALTPEEARAFALRYGVTSVGNFEHGNTVLSQDQTVDQVARAVGESYEEAETLLDSARRKLFARRSRRVAPGRDDKILASWNGLMISGLAWASRAIGSEAALAAARQAFDVLRTKLVRDRESGRLFSTYKDGQARLNAYLDDYAFLAMAALDLARFESDPARVASCLESAAQWTEFVIRHFKDRGAPGYFFTSDDHEQLIQRPKMLLDQAAPSGTAVMLSNLSAISEIDVGGRGNVFYAELDQQLRALFPLAAQNPYGCCELLNAALLETLGPVVVSGREVPALISHSNVFQKPADASLTGCWLICHKKACGRPLRDTQTAQSEVLSKLKSA